MHFSCSIGRYRERIERERSEGTRDRIYVGRHHNYVIVLIPLEEKIPPRSGWAVYFRSRMWCSLFSLYYFGPQIPPNYRFKHKTYRHT